jgi:hypothetical protein
MTVAYLNIILKQLTFLNRLRGNGGTPYSEKIDRLATHHLSNNIKYIFKLLNNAQASELYLQSVEKN